RANFMKMHLPFFAFLCLSFLLASVSAESASKTVRDHGPVAPVAFPVFGGSVATTGPGGDRVVVCPVWVGWNDEGVRGSAFLTINVDNASTTLTPTVYGDTAFGSFLSDANKLYFAQDGQLVEFDVAQNRVREIGKHPNRLP